MTKPLIIGSRGSELALWQAHYVQDQLKAIGVASEIRIITTKGDRIQDLSFDKIEGKGFFTKEIEEALLRNEIDLAVHSHKDLETQSPPGLVVAAVSQRADPAELLLIRPESVDNTLPLGFKKQAVIGTSSARRKGQVKDLRPDITIRDIRGNVPTRVNKLRKGDFDAILLASAGINRLGLDLSDLVVHRLDPRVLIPAPAQGVLAYQCRENDTTTIGVLQKLNDQKVSEAITIERGILAGFGGGCHVPIGVYADPMTEGFAVRVSFAPDWEVFSKRVRLHVNSRNEAVEKFNALSLAPLPSSVFISKTLGDDSFLKRACKAWNITLTDSPLIGISTLEFQLPASFEWIFFSSSNAVAAFFERVGREEIRGKKLGVLGEATARSLYQYVPAIDFIGSAEPPAAVASAFAAAASGAVVLFPGSDISRESVQSVLPADRVISLPVYKTVKKGFRTNEAFDVYIFTSPSNADAFFEAGNAIPGSSKVIAIGEATAGALARHRQNPLVAAIPHEAELLTLLAS